ncbi:unnamed protein product [Acanthoscelides obtectus]|uniref:Uncharacterized protein n=1 Tax=Acanthoscelides obtectus TaxID=200917 RepID=A0A9P0KID4_ACAOB|nr:unnamed protein product [Acanthoscelides obtectus]CAK1680147.1 hypothetical protein AOBTE_LOCUS32520 [Acanthoscelides obtectus]
MKKISICEKKSSGK